MEIQRGIYGEETKKELYNGRKHSEKTHGNGWQGNCCLYLLQKSFCHLRSRNFLCDAFSDWWSKEVKLSICIATITCHIILLLLLIINNLKCILHKGIVQSNKYWCMINGIIVLFYTWGDEKVQSWNKTKHSVYLIRYMLSCLLLPKDDQKRFTCMYRSLHRIQ